MKKKIVYTCLALATLSTLVGCNPGGGGGEKTEFTVTFNTQQGTEVPSQKVKKGEKVIKPDVIPTRGEDETFSGWFTSPTDKTKYNFDNAVNSDFTIYAQYTTTSYYIDGSTDVDLYNEDKHKFVVKDKSDNPQEGFTYGTYFPDFKEEEVSKIKIDPTTGVLTECNVNKYVYGYIYAYKKMDDEKYLHAVKEVEFATYDMLLFNNGSVKFNKGYKFDDTKFRYSVPVIIPEYYVDSNKLVKVKAVEDKGFDKDNFKYDESDHSIYLANTIETIGEEAFNVTARTEITNMPKAIKTIGRRAFYGCRFTYMNKDFSDTKLESIGEEAFCNVNLSSMNIYLPASLKSIGARAFSVSDGSSISRPHLIDFKDPYYFSINNGYKQYVVLTNTEDNAAKFFKGGEYCESGVIKHEITSSGIKYEYVSITDKTIKVTGLEESFTGEEVTIPSTIMDGNDTYTVTEIDSEAFKDKTNLKNIYLPESLVKISDSAFSGCTSLSSIYIPKNVNSIGKHVFNDCPLGKILVDSQNQTYINYNDGVDQSTIYSMDFKILYYGSSGYYDKGIQMHSSTEIICEDAFNGRKSGNKGITIPEKVKEIGKNAFNNCFSEEGTVNPTIKFENASRLWTLDDGTTVVRVNDSSENVTNLTSEHVGKKWKWGTASSGITYVVEDGVVYAKQNKKEPCTDANIVIADSHNDRSVTHISSDGFKGNQMTTISLPSYLTDIFDCAFEGCSKLDYIVIPKTCKKIGINVFKDCTNLTKIYFEDVSSHWNIKTIQTHEILEKDVYVGDAAKNAIKFKDEKYKDYYYWEKIG